jgi:hypothetical protein
VLRTRLLHSWQVMCCQGSGEGDAGMDVDEGAAGPVDADGWTTVVRRSGRRNAGRRAGQGPVDMT